jgi:hypothetical protein
MGYANYGKVGALPGINCDDAAFFPAFASPEERRFRGIAIFSLAAKPSQVRPTGDERLTRALAGAPAGEREGEP